MKIFISYRRDDTRDFVGRLADRLRRAYGISGVFLDVESLTAGENFEARIDAELKECDISLVVIGRNWLGVRGSDGARIFDDDDFIRREVRQALKSETRVIPVLANGAVMAGGKNLPEDIRKLEKLNALSVRQEAFERDTEHLLDEIFARRKPGPVGEFFKRHRILHVLLQSFMWAGGALALLTIILALINTFAYVPLSHITGDDPSAATLLTGLVMLMSGSVPWILHLRRAARH